MAVKTGPGPYVAAIIGPPGPLVGGTSFRVTVYAHQNSAVANKRTRVRLQGI